MVIEGEPLLQGLDAEHGDDLADHGVRRAAHQLDFQPVGLDLRQVEDVVDQGEEVLAAGEDDFQVVFALGLVVLLVALAQQVGEADDGVQRRADFVAHVGQEAALGDVGGLGDFLGLDQFLLGLDAAVDFLAQLGGPFHHPLLQLVVRLLQGLVRGVDAIQHAVELAAEHAQLVLGLLLDADRVVSQGGDRGDGLGKPADGRGDVSLQQSGQQDGGSQGQQDHHRDDLGVGGQLAVQVGGVGADIEGAHPFAMIDDPAEDLDPAPAGEAAPVDGPRLRQRRGVHLRGVGGQHLVVGVVEAGELHRRLGLQRAEELPGGGDIAEAQHAGAVEGQHAGLGLQRLHLHRTHGIDLVEAQPGGRHRQRHPHRHHGQQDQFRLDRPIANGNHRSAPYG